jgi:hypothetical protein
LHHHLNLLFGRTPSTYNRFFYLERGVFVDGEISVCKCAECGTSGLAQ